MSGARIFLFLVLLLGLGCLLPAQAPPPSVVFVEGYDAEGELQSRTLGVVVKKGFVAVNYHAVAGMASVGIFEQDKPQKIVSEGYLSVEESKEFR